MALTGEAKGVGPEDPEGSRGDPAGWPKSGCRDATRTLWHQGSTVAEKEG